MKKIISLLLAVLILSTPVLAVELPDGLFTQEQLDAVFNNEEIKAKAKQWLEDLQSVNEQIKAMSDDELRQAIIDLAEQYKIPTLNDEQLNFLVEACRSPEKIEDIANTIQTYSEKVNTFQQAVRTLTETLSNLLDKFTGILDSLNGLFGKAAE